MGKRAEDFNKRAQGQNPSQREDQTDAGSFVESAERKDQVSMAFVTQ